MTGFPSGVQKRQDIGRALGHHGDFADVRACLFHFFQTTCDVRFGGRLMEIVVAHQDGGFVRFGGGIRR